MMLRGFLIASLALCYGSALAATARPAPRVAPTPPMTFYVARGAPDACGPGCDSWIVVEGQVDSGAAPRFRKFLQKVRARNLPIYFSSPGGTAAVMGWPSVQRSPSEASSGNAAG